MLKPNQYSLFYNTIKEPKVVVAQYEAANATQQDLVLEYFRREKRSTTARAARVLNINLNSVRRSVTNLTDMGKLIKTNERVVEQFGKVNFIYEIA